MLVVLNHMLSVLIVGKSGSNERHEPESLLRIITYFGLFGGVSSVAWVANTHSFFRRKKLNFANVTV